MHYRNIYSTSFSKWNSDKYLEASRVKICDADIYLEKPI